MDVWGAGCVLFEITSLFPLFPGADEVDQINRIHKVVGTPRKEILIELRKVKSSKMDFKFREQKGVGIKHFIPHASRECVDLLNRTLQYDYQRRITSREACEHGYFDSLRIKKGITSKKSGSTSPTSVQSLHGKDLRDEKSTNRQRRLEKKVESTSVIKAKKTQPSARNFIKVRILVFFLYQ